MGGSQLKLTEAFRRFDEIHAEDPKRISKDGMEVPWSLHYHRRMTHWLDRLEPNASDALRLAARCQHIRRWTVPRNEYPEGKLGYKKWRSDLAVFHGEQAEAVLSGCGFGGAVIQRVKDLLQKKGLKTDPEVQTLEDVICLVFLENEFAEFSAKHSEEKLHTILRKTWAKMSERGHGEALSLAESLPPEAAGVLQRALGGRQ